MANFPNSQGRKVVLALIQTIVDHKAYLSEVDGKIGDGDHGINMAKGFNLIKDRLGDKEISLGDGLGLIGKTLMTEIGGSMGPIYGTFFIQMSLKSKNKPETDAPLFGEMLKAAREALEDLGGAKVGDKTLMDAVVPAQEAYQAAVDAGASLPEAFAQDDDVAAVGPIFVLGKCAADNDGSAEQPEEVGAHLPCGDLFGVASAR